MWIGAVWQLRHNCALDINFGLWGNAVAKRGKQMECAALPDLFLAGRFYRGHAAGALLLWGALAPQQVWLGQWRDDRRYTARHCSRSLRPAGFPAVYRAKGQRKRKEGDKAVTGMQIVREETMRMLRGMVPLAFSLNSII